MLAEIAKEENDYNKFYEQFGKCLKLGVHGDPTNRATVAEQLRCHASKSGDQQIGLKEYADRTKEGQNDGCCITGEGITAVSSSPFQESLWKKGLGVTCVIDPACEHAAPQLTEFDGKSLQSTTAKMLRH